MPKYGLRELLFFINFLQTLIENQQLQFQMEKTENAQSVSICSELNLKIQQLKIQKLLQNPIYRRLFNIVAFDTNKTQYQCRKNLVKQLFFLLKLTKIMRPQLQDAYLNKIQEWYNLNDHKKTELASKQLKNLLSDYFGAKQQKHNENLRPQSGVNWNKNISPFLRPYTAQRTNTSKVRPDSHKSKFGRSNMSTNIDSCEQLTIKDCYLSIEQQFEVSQDFIKKNRTIHPQALPIYEQLFNIIKKADPNYRNLQNNQNEILFQKDKQQFSKIVISQSKNNLNPQQEEEKVQDADLFQHVSEQSQRQDDQEKDDKQVIEQQPTHQKKVFQTDQNVLSINQKAVDQYNFLKVTNRKDQLLLKKVNNKYLHVTKNKIINVSKDDNELVRNYTNYTRVKSAMKRQLNRKSQSQRLLSAKSRSTTNLTVGTKRPNNQRIYSALPQKAVKNSQFANQKNFFDFSGVQDKQNQLMFKKSPTYNQREELDAIYRRPIDSFKKANKNNISVAEITCKQKKLLTQWNHFLSGEKFNPMAHQNIQKHNKQALEQIQKIKMKCNGLDKKWLSCQSLTKALYINSYDNISTNKNNLANDISLKEQNAAKFGDWKSMDPYFNMISNGTKKKKLKKSRKLVKK